MVLGASSVYDGGDRPRELVAPLLAGLFSGATAREPQADHAGQTYGSDADDDQHADCAEQHRHQQKEGRGCGVQHRLDDAEEDAEDGQSRFTVGAFT